MYTTITCPECNECCSVKQGPVNKHNDPFICFDCNWVQGFGVRDKDFIYKLISGKMGLTYTHISKR